MCEGVEYTEVLRLVQFAKIKSMVVLHSHYISKISRCQVCESLCDIVWVSISNCGNIVTLWDIKPFVP